MFDQSGVASFVQNGPLPSWVKMVASAPHPKA